MRRCGRDSAPQSLPISQGQRDPRVSCGHSPAPISNQEHPVSCPAASGSWCPKPGLKLQAVRSEHLLGPGCGRRGCSGGGREAPGRCGVRKSAGASSWERWPCSDAHCRSLSGEMVLQYSGSQVLGLVHHRQPPTLFPGHPRPSSPPVPVAPPPEVFSVRSGRCLTLR